MQSEGALLSTKPQVAGVPDYALTPCEQPHSCSRDTLARTAQGHKELCEMLIQRGADAQIKDFPLKPEARATRPGAMCEPAARRPRAQRNLARCGAVG